MYESTQPIECGIAERLHLAGGAVEIEPIPTKAQVMIADKITQRVLRLEADDIERFAAAIVDRRESGVHPELDTWLRDHCIRLDDDDADRLARGLYHLAAEIRTTGLKPAGLDASDGLVRDLVALFAERTRAA